MERKSFMRWTAIGVICVLALCAVLLFLFLRTENDEEGPMPRPNSNKDYLQMPSITEYDSKSHPIVHDFLYGSLGKDTDLDMGTLAPCEAVLLRLDDLSSIFVSDYTIAERVYEPLIGGAPVAVHPDEVQQQAIANAVSQMRNRWDEGEWTLLLLNRVHSDYYMEGNTPYDHMDDDSHWMGIDMTPALVAGASIAYEDAYDNGYGFDTQWLRKYGEYLPDSMRADDGFWDRYRLMQVIRTEFGTDGVVTATVVGYDRFNVVEMGRKWDLNEEAYLSVVEGLQSGRITGVDGVVTHDHDGGDSLDADSSYQNNVEVRDDDQGNKVVTAPFGSRIDEDGYLVDEQGNYVLVNGSRLRVGQDVSHDDGNDDSGGGE